MFDGFPTQQRLSPFVTGSVATAAAAGSTLGSTLESTLGDEAVTPPRLRRHLSSEQKHRNVDPIALGGCRALRDEGAA
eukprot:CAMPEP_0171831260 /NCGR_PEP_ID=MMETSP0992-20121227/8681_1 /TAXON_ID=483369 /ORGANISM="non described non described, Strain CCMP2098" /LENGTH=77 /DNA_ID=CAMNT_0012446657 /DNA_START=701 /DNA_END=930 /DNA_ORIENTATION=+